MKIASMKPLRLQYGPRHRDVLTLNLKDVGKHDHILIIIEICPRVTSWRKPC